MDLGPDDRPMTRREVVALWLTALVFCVGLWAFICWTLVTMAGMQ
jgi:hypothetical protein